MHTKRDLRVPLFSTKQQDTSAMNHHPATVQRRQLASQPMSAQENMELLTKVLKNITEAINKLPDSPEKGMMIQKAAFLSIAGNFAIITNAENSYFQIFGFESRGTSVAVSRQEPSPLTVATHTYINEGSTPIDPTFTQEAIFEESFTFGFKEGIKVGASAEVGFDIGLANGKVSVSTEVNFEAQQTVSKKQTLSYKADLPVTVAPCSTRVVRINLEKEVFYGTYTLDLMPYATTDFMETSFYQSFFQEKNLEEIFPELTLTMNQKGRINGVAGMNWTTTVGPDKPIEGGCQQVQNGQRLEMAAS